MFIRDVLAFFLSTLIILVISFVRVNASNAYLLLTILLIFSMVLISRYPKIRVNSPLSALARWFVIFNTSLIVQLLIFATGGFFSPFLVLLHFCTFAIAIFMNIGSSVLFMMLSLIVIFLDLQLDLGSLNIFAEDPWTVVLYLISFVVIIAVAHVLVRNYNIKDKYLKKLGGYLKISESRQESILRGLTELVLITDTSLKILVANSAVEKAIGIGKIDLVGSLIGDVIKLENKEGKSLNNSLLTSDKLLSYKTTRSFKDIYLKSRNGINPINLIVSPTADQKGNITQIAFIISKAHLEFQRSHSDLEEAISRQAAVSESLRKDLALNNRKDVKTKIKLFTKIGEDLRIAQEIEDHPLVQRLKHTNIFAICREIVEEKKDFTNNLGVSLTLFSEEVTGSYSEPDYSSYIDESSLKVLISSILDIVILLVSSEEKRDIKFVLRSSVDSSVKGSLSFSCLSVPLGKEQDFFKQYYGDLGERTNLKLGSGLEGFISKNVARMLNVLLKVEREEGTNAIRISLLIPSNQHIDNSF